MILYAGNIYQVYYIFFISSYFQNLLERIEFSKTEIFYSQLLPLTTKFHKQYFIFCKFFSIKIQKTCNQKYLKAHTKLNNNILTQLNAFTYTHTGCTEVEGIIETN